MVSGSQQCPRAMQDGGSLVNGENSVKLQFGALTVQEQDSPEAGQNW